MRVGDDEPLLPQSTAVVNAPWLVWVGTLLSKRVFFTKIGAYLQSGYIWRGIDLAENYISYSRMSPA